jgi:hypothetical protein
MALDATARRRWFGVIALAAALVMLLCGETVLKEKLKNLTFVYYWMVCFGFTCLAILIALWDARALRRRTTREHRDLFEATLKEIEAKARTKPPPRDLRRNGS